MVCGRCGTVFCWDDADQILLGSDKKKYCGKSCSHKVSPSSRRSKRRRRELASHTETVLAGCAERGKMPFRTSGDAEREARRLAVTRGLCLYPYQCRCSAWHLTSAPQATRNGTVTRWTPGSSGGVIRSDDDTSWWVSWLDLPEGFTKLPVGTRVEFTGRERRSKKGRRRRAYDVQVATAPGEATSPSPNAL